MDGVPDTHADLLDAEFATLATTGSDGAPSQTEVWFLYDEGEDRVKMSLNDTRRKVEHLRARPACSVLILDLGNPYRYLAIRGVARVEDDPDKDFAARVGVKYDTDPTQYDEPGDGRVVVTIEPRRVRAVDMSAG